MPLRQLSPQDAAFVSIETPDLPAHIGGLVFLDPASAPDDRPFDYARFVEFVRERIGTVDRFAWRLQEVPFGLDRPYWIRQRDFDPADHLHAIRIPEPYSPEALGQLVGRMFERPMDRGRPLWDMALIEGLPGGRFAMLWRTHHCMMDGAAGASLVEQLFDLSPAAERPARSTQARPDQPGRRVRSLPLWARTVRHAWDYPRKHAALIGKSLAGALPARSDQERLSVEETDAAHDALAPRVSWNGVVGSHRRFAWSTISLDEVKRIKKSLDVTVNDVVLAVTGGAARDFLQARDALPATSLRASVPCSTRTKEDVSLGNQITDLPVDWGTDVADPVERIMKIHRSAKAAKARAAAGEAVDMVGTLSESLLPGALNLFIRAAAAAGDHAPLPTNAVVSNVPMAPIPLFVAGAQIEEVYPISLLAPTQGLNITVVSYQDRLHFGLIHDPKLLPQAWELAGLIPKNLQKLQQALDTQLELGFES